MARYILFTDGGLRFGVPAAAACLIRDEYGKQLKKVASLVKAPSPFDAEFEGLLLGLDTISRMQRKTDRPTLEWYSDCQPLVLLVKKFIKTNKLPDSQHDFLRHWDELSAYLQLISLDANFSSNSKDIERCDRACRWLQKSSKKLFAKYGEGPAGKVSEGSETLPWSIYDVRV